VDFQAIHVADNQQWWVDILKARCHPHWPFSLVVSRLVLHILRMCGPRLPGLYNSLPRLKKIFRLPASPTEPATVILQTGWRPQPPLGHPAETCCGSGPTMHLQLRRRRSHKYVVQSRQVVPRFDADTPPLRDIRPWLDIHRSTKRRGSAGHQA
jgi:hypothetical protein